MRLARLQNKTIVTVEIEYLIGKESTGMRTRVEGGENLVSRGGVEFRITNLDVHVPRGLPILWRGYKISTGPLDLGLDDSTGISCGVMNYELGVVLSEFHVLIRFRRFALQLKALGMDADLVAPIHALLKTEGEILPDHSFNGGLRGSCKVESHKMFSSQALRVEILPGL